MIPPVFFNNICKNLPVCFKATNTFTLSYSTISKMATPQWQVEKSKLLNLAWMDKRKLYKIKDYIPLSSVEPWSTYVVKNPGVESKKHTLDDLTEWKKTAPNGSLNKDLVHRVSIFKGDITKLEVSVRTFLFDRRSYKKVNLSIFILFIIKLFDTNWN